MIKNKSEDLCGRIDGSIPETDKATIHANPIGKFLVQHRNVYVNFIHNRIKPRQFNYNT